MNIKIFVCVELLLLMHTMTSYADEKQKNSKIEISNDEQNNDSKENLNEETSIEKKDNINQDSKQSLTAKDDKNENQAQKKLIDKNDSLDKILKDIDNFKNLDDSDSTEYDYNNSQKFINKFLLTVDLGFNGFCNTNIDYSIFGSHTLGFGFLYNLFMLSRNIDIAIGLEHEYKSFKTEEIDNLLMINVYDNNPITNEIEKKVLYNKNIIDSLKLNLHASFLTLKFGIFLDNIDPQNDFLFNIIYNFGLYHNCKVINNQNDSKIIVSSSDLIKVKRFFNALGLEIFYMRVGLFYRHQLNGFWEEKVLEEKNIEKNYYPFHFGIIVNLI